MKRWLKNSLIFSGIYISFWYTTILLSGHPNPLFAILFASIFLIPAIPIIIFVGFIIGKLYPDKEKKGIKQSSNLSDQVHNLRLSKGINFGGLIVSLSITLMILDKFILNWRINEIYDSTLILGLLIMGFGILILISRPILKFFSTQGK